MRPTSTLPFGLRLSASGRMPDSCWAIARTNCGLIPWYCAASSMQSARQSNGADAKRKATTRAFTTPPDKEPDLVRACNTQRISSLPAYARSPCSVSREIGAHFPVEFQPALPLTQHSVWHGIRTPYHATTPVSFTEVVPPHPPSANPSYPNGQTSVHLNLSAQAAPVNVGVVECPQLPCSLRA
jgi:hypothetical protein